MMFETKPRSLLNLLRFSAKIEEIINDKAAAATPAAAADPDAPTTSTAILESAQRREAADRVTSLYDALLHDERAIEVVPLVLRHADGREVTPEEAAGDELESDVFAAAIAAFFGCSPKLTRGLLGLPSGTAVASAPTSPTSQK